MSFAGGARKAAWRLRRDAGSRGRRRGAICSTLHAAVLGELQHRLGWAVCAPYLRPQLPQHTAGGHWLHAPGLATEHPAKQHPATHCPASHRPAMHHLATHHLATHHPDTHCPRCAAGD
eukprot:110532-Chlamydomonas_euryale.AAC.2